MEWNTRAHIGTLRDALVVKTELLEAALKARVILLRVLENAVDCVTVAANSGHVAIGVLEAHGDLRVQL